MTDPARPLPTRKLIRGFRMPAPAGEVTSSTIRPRTLAVHDAFGSRAWRRVRVCLGRLEDRFQRANCGCVRTSLWALMIRSRGLTEGVRMRETMGLVEYVYRPKLELQATRMRS